ncbi:MAG: hypothetical protein AB8B69_23045 [Chitinophagales bacterium]
MKKVTFSELISFNGVAPLENHQLNALKGGGGDDIKYPLCRDGEKPCDDEEGDEERFIPPPGPG